MSILTQVSEKMREKLQTFADQAALDCRFVERKRKLTGSAFVQMVVFGWLENPEASYADLAETASALDIDVSRQAIEQRMTPEGAEMIKTVLEAIATGQGYFQNRTHLLCSTSLPEFTCKTAPGLPSPMNFTLFGRGPVAEPSSRKPL